MVYDDHIGRGRALRIAIGIMLLFLMQVGGVSAVNYISGCHDTYPINSPGEYVLTQNIQTMYTYIDNCIVINSSNVIFDGAGHWILGDRYNQGSPYYYNGIYVSIKNNVTVKNVHVRDWAVGIRYFDVQNGSIINSTAWVNVWAGFVIASGTTNITLINNSAYESWGSILYGEKGFTLEGNNTVDTTNKVHGRPVYYLFEKNNIILDGIEAGFLELSNSSNITIRNSLIKYGDGIELLNSSGNKIYHNNLIINSRFRLNEATDEITLFPQAFDDSSNNFWDNGYPSGGNYWSDYKGTDFMSGPNQDQPGSDGIGDTPYYIDGKAGAKDKYPFMRENGWISQIDTTSPVINSVTLSDSTPNIGDSILVTVNATDNVEVTGVMADGVSFIKQSNDIWNGTINALVGTHSVNVSARDATGNVTWDNSTSYTATTPTQPPKTGDINGNGQLTLVDAIYLAKHVGGFSGYETISADGDINGNGQVSLVDAIYLAKHVGGFIGYETIY